MSKTFKVSIILKHISLPLLQKHFEKIAGSSVSITSKVKKLNGTLQILNETMTTV